MKSNSNFLGFVAGLLIAVPAAYVLGQPTVNLSEPESSVVVDYRTEDGKRVKNSDGSEHPPFTMHAALLPRLDDYVRFDDDGKEATVYTVKSITHWPNFIIVTVAGRTKMPYKRY